MSSGVGLDTVRGRRVAVIGAGSVGAATINALVLLGAADQLVLYDRDISRAEGQAWDTADGTPLVRGVEIVATDDWRALRGTDVAVVTVGAPPLLGRSRRDERNGGLIRQVVVRSPCRRSRASPTSRLRWQTMCDGAAPRSSRAKVTPPAASPWPSAGTHSTIRRDQRRILTVSSRAPSHYGLGESLVLSLPCVVGRAGVIGRLPLALDCHERQMLERSAAILEETYRDQSGDPAPSSM